jgi:hypothetical protein
VGRETDNADSPECGNLASNVDRSESALSDLNLGIGKALSTGMRSAPRMSGQMGNQAGEAQTMHKDEDITHDCVAGDGRASPRASASGGTGAQKSEMIQERVLELGEGRTVTMWKEQTASIGKPNGTQISYEEFSAGDAFANMGGPLSHSRRKQSNRDLLKTKDEEKGEGSKWKGKDVEAARDRRLSEGHKNVSTHSSLENNCSDDFHKAVQPRSFSSPAHTPRSERMYSAAELDVPPPPSEYSLSEFASANIPRSSRTKTDKEIQNQDQPRTSTLTKARPLANRHSKSSTDSAKATSVTWLDDFLSSFQPSLVHIASILTSLGIRHEDHFRAVVRLSEETRDREVRDVALQKGMTVVEWAMLLDRIRSL